jgi:predicted nucleic acid-binding protein
MTQSIIVDTGVLIALLSRDDAQHQWAINVASKLSKPLLTCEAVLTETCFLLRRNNQDHKPIFDLVERAAITLPFCIANEYQAVTTLMTRYQNVPMSLADACLVRMVEIYANASIFTLDSDFKIYRKNRNQVIPIIMPT